MRKTVKNNKKKGGRYRIHGGGDILRYNWRDSAYLPSIEGGEGTNVWIVAWLGKWLLLHPVAKYILYKRYNIETTSWCSFPVLRLAKEMINDCRGKRGQVAIDDIEAAMDVDLNATRAIAEKTQSDIEEGDAIEKQYNIDVANEAENNCSHGGRRTRKKRKARKRKKRKN